MQSRWRKLIVVKASATHEQLEQQLRELKALVKVEPEIITPESAAELLKTRNFRDLNIKQARMIAAQIKAFGWSMNGEAIIIDEFGNLCDGQHRLQAAVESKASIISVVYRGPTDFLTVDGNGPGKRTAAQFVDQLGRPNPNLTVAILRLLVAYQAGGPAGVRQALMRRLPLSVIETKRYLDRFEHLAEAVQQVKNFRGCFPSTLGFVACKAAEINETAAWQFVDDVNRGTNLTHDSPVYILRKRLADNERSKAKLSQVDVSALLILAWNAYRAGRTIRTLFWRGSGPQAQEFPDFDRD